MNQTWEKITISDPIIEYRKILGSGVLVVRVIVCEDPSIAMYLEMMAPRYQVSPYHAPLSEIMDTLADASQRLKAAQKPLSGNTQE